MLENNHYLLASQRKQLDTRKNHENLLRRRVRSPRGRRRFSVGFGLHRQNRLRREDVLFAEDVPPAVDVCREHRQRNDRGAEEEDQEGREAQDDEVEAVLQEGIQGFEGEGREGHGGAVRVVHREGFEDVQLRHGEGRREGLPREGTLVFQFVSWVWVC